MSGWKSKNGKLVFIQHGDYKDAVYRFMAGGEEYYHAQRYTVEAVAELVPALKEVAVVCVRSEPYDELLPNGVRALGCPLDRKTGFDHLVATLDGLAPSGIVLRSPMFPVLNWARRRRVRVLPIFADSFPRRGLRNRWRFRKLARRLNGPDIDWVGNHNLPASRNLVELGVEAGRIVPYDYPPEQSPWRHEVHEEPRAPYRCMYVGKIARIKGVEECIRAVQSLNESGLDCTLDIIGGGDETASMKRLVSSLGLDDRISFLGTVPHNRITAEMRKRDVVIVSTRREYNESGPMTINEALAARTPIVASDHPVIAERVQDGRSAKLYRAGDHVSMTEALRRVLTDRRLYEHLSRNAPGAWEKLQCPVKWADLVTCWVRNAPEDREWLNANTLQSGLFNMEWSHARSA